MAFYHKRKEVISIIAGGKVISSIRQGANVIWRAVRSCFGKGMWIPAKPWSYKEGWKENCKY